MGGYFAGLLVGAGHEVTLLARGRTLAAVRQSGIRLEEPGVPMRVLRAHAVDTLDGVAPADLVLVCVKSWQVAEVAPQLLPVVGDGTVVVPIQNVVDAGDRLAAVLGTEHAVGGSGFVVAMQTVPGAYARLGRAPTMEIGALDRTIATRRLDDVAALLTAAGIGAKVSGDIRRTLWRKLTFIASFGGVCALARASAEEIRTQPRARALVESAMREVAAVANAGGIGVTDADVARSITQLDGLPPDGTSSMARDIWDGRPSELTDQNGAVVEYGERFGVPTPVHSVVLGALLPGELRARG
jgi:2-dehydropantoate 2-reductase